MAPPWHLHGTTARRHRAPHRAELDAEVGAYEAWEARAGLVLSRTTLGAGYSGEEEPLSPEAEARRRERATHFALDRVKNRRWLDVQCTEVLGRPEVLGVPRLLHASHQCFRIRQDGY